MIMPRGQQLLLPANPLFIWGSLLGALLVDLLPIGQTPWMPDVLAIVLVFWAVHQPRRVGLGVAFLFGLGIDVHQGALLGQHALAYAVLGYLAIMVHRRLLWFAVPQQAVQLMPLLIAMHLIQVLVRLMAGDGWPGWSILLAPVLEAALWPVASLVLLAPQRRAPNPDENRPL